jgi:hypothetical protein
MLEVPPERAAAGKIAHPTMVSAAFAGSGSPFAEYALSSVPLPFTIVIEVQQ